MLSIKEKYTKEVVPKLKESLGIKNSMALPKIEKVVVNTGMHQGAKTKEYIALVDKTLERITGQRPLVTKAKQSIASFKIREGMELGRKVTLRGTRMNDFLTKLVDVTMPRIRDFQGLSPKSIDRQGNLTIGFKEHVAFPEIKSDEIDRLHGVEVTIVTSATDPEKARALFIALGFPFQKSK
jgi:large subunit ribosomal protein L5